MFWTLKKKLLNLRIWNRAPKNIKISKNYLIFKRSFFKNWFFYQKFLNLPKKAQKSSIPHFSSNSIKLFILLTHSNKTKKLSRLNWILRKCRQRQIWSKNSDTVANFHLNALLLSFSTFTIGWKAKIHFIVILIAQKTLY
jgi:hypothetical protein